MRVGITIDVQWHLIRARPQQPLVLSDQFDENVCVMTLFPGISVSMLRHTLEPPLKGLVLRTYGAGNAPDQNEVRGRQLVTSFQVVLWVMPPLGSNRVHACLES